jgi:hypothetical protein
VRLILLFLGTIAAVLATLMLLTWWMDPFGQFYDRGVLRAARAGPRPCLISEDLIGSGSWLPFKEDVFRTRHPRTVVLGTSRVLKMGSPSERDFANLGVPGMGIETLEPFFRRLSEDRPGPLTVYIGVELFWFNRSWSPPIAFVSSRLSDVRYLLARQNVTKSVSLVFHHPSFLWHRWQRERIGPWCALDRGSRLREGKRYAWQVNGSVVYQSEVLGRSTSQAVRGNSLTVLGLYFSNWSEFDRARLRRLDAALGLARSYGWRVVGFASPSTTRYADLLASIPGIAPRWRQFGELVPPVFRRHHFAFLDLRRAVDVPCPETAFYQDSWHPKQSCLDIVRRRLERAVASEEGATGGRSASTGRNGESRHLSRPYPTGLPTRYRGNR